MPLIFVFVFAATPSSGDAWANFMLEELHMSYDKYGYILAVGSVGGFVGVQIYRRFFIASNVRVLYAVVIVFATGISLMTLIVVFRINVAWGISDFAFSFGDEVVVSMVAFIIQMPILVVTAKLAPKGVESTVYAFGAAVHNIGSSLGSNLSALAIRSFGIKKGNFENLWKLIVLCANTTFIVLPLLFLLPKYSNQISPISTTSKKGKSKWGGALCILFVFGTLIFSICQALFQISSSDDDTPPLPGNLLDN